LYLSIKCSKPPKRHDLLDWVNLVVLIFTFLAAGVAAFEAKRLADGTDQLIIDGRKIADVILSGGG